MLFSASAAFSRKPEIPANKIKKKKKENKENKENKKITVIKLRRLEFVLFFVVLFLKREALFLKLEDIVKRRNVDM